MYRGTLLHLTHPPPTHISCCPSTLQTSYMGPHSDFDRHFPNLGKNIIRFQPPRYRSSNMCMLSYSINRYRCICRILKTIGCLLLPMSSYKSISHSESLSRYAGTNNDSATWLDSDINKYVCIIECTK